jgi:hypothetical protein
VLEAALAKVDLSVAADFGPFCHSVSTAGKHRLMNLALFHLMAGKRTALANFTAGYPASRPSPVSTCGSSTRCGCVAMPVVVSNKRP